MHVTDFAPGQATYRSSSLLRPARDDGMRPHSSQGFGRLITDSGVATSDEDHLSREVHSGVGDTGTHVDRG